MKALDEWDQVRGVRFENLPFSNDVELIFNKLLELDFHGSSIRQETGTDPIGRFPEPQVDAGRLDIRGRNFEIICLDKAGVHGPLESLAGQDPLGLVR